MSEQKQTPLNSLTPEVLDAAWAAFDTERPNESDPALILINDRIDANRNRGGYRERFLQAAANNDWRRKIPALATEYFETLHHLNKQKAFLSWYGEAYPELTAENPWYAGHIARIAFLENAASVSSFPTARAVEGNTRKNGTKSATKSKSQHCAEDVAKIHQELHIILPSIEAGQDDYQTLQRENPRFLTFKAVQRSPQLKDTILLLPCRRGRLLGLAQRLAGVLHQRKPETVKKDWNRFKPAKYRRSK